MRIINKIHKGEEKGWVEWEPVLGEQIPFGFTEKEVKGFPQIATVEMFKYDNKDKGNSGIILRKKHNELNYTTGQSKKGIKPPAEYKVSEYGYRKDHYHYYFPESVKLGTYTCSTCQGVKRDKLKCCEEPSEIFFEHGYDGGGCHACYDWITDLKCVKCYIKNDCFSYTCRLEDNGDYVIKD